MRIVCGTDFSAPGQQAATVAGLLARQTGGELHLIHGLGPRRRWDFTAERTELENEGRRLQEQGVAVTGINAVWGDPNVVMIEEATRWGAELIVLGATGQRLADLTLLGSVASRTARESPVPVLVVRDAAPFVAWLEKSAPLRVLTGFERGESTNHALRWAASLRRLGTVNLTVAQLVTPGLENRRAEASGPGAGIELHPSTRSQLLEELRLATAPAIGDISATLTVKPAIGRTDIHLVQEAEGMHADLVVVGSHQRKGFQRWWHGSVSSGVVHGAPMSVAVVPYRPSES